MIQKVKRRLIEARKIAREGKRFAAFYRGCKDSRAGRTVNPFAPGSVEARCWQAGHEYEEGGR